VAEFHAFSAGDGDPVEKMAEFFGPEQVDHSIRQAVQFCWMSLPKGRRTSEELEKQLRRLFERALKDFREDREAFGLPGDARPGTPPA
jgi:hypothetical protein